MATHIAMLGSGFAGHQIDDKFTLLEWLGATDTGDAFLAGLPQGGRAALLLTLAEPATAQDQLRNWQAAANLDHPHLVRTLAFGRTDVDGADLLYLVTELPEESLAQVLPERPLTPDETREMLGPIVEALAYLHGRNLLHGNLHPGAILVAEGRLKLSTYSVRQAGSLRGFDEILRIYDAPESKSEPLGAAADVWSLGITLVESLTQRPPAWIRSSGRDPLVPVTVPQPFADIARKCLRVEAADRCTLEQVAEILNTPAAAVEFQAAALPLAAASLPAAEQIELFAATAPDSRPDPDLNAAPHAAPHAAPDAQPFRRAMRGIDNDDTAPIAPKRYMQAAIAAAVILFVLIVGWAAYRHRSRNKTVDSTAATPAASTDTSAPAPAQPVRSRSHSASTKGEVTHRVLPEIPDRAARGIHGKVDVRIRATVDHRGQVTNATIESQGKSRFFAERALAAARKWEFKPAHADSHPAASAWEIHFTFRKEKVEATAAQVTP